jgi:hypothetical protein
MRSCDRKLAKKGFTILRSMPKPLFRIIVKDGRMIEVAPVTGSPKVAATGVDFVKKKWEFSPDQNLIVRWEHQEGTGQ